MADVFTRGIPYGREIVAVRPEGAVVVNHSQRDRVEVVRPKRPQQPADEQPAEEQPADE